MLDADVLVLGAGIGGLAAALALARAGQRVHVVEQHSVPGGFCQSFKFEGLRFDPGLHYLGALGSGGVLRHLLEGLGVSADVSFFELDPAGYDHLCVGASRFAYPAGRDALEQRLFQRFPSQARGVGRYLDVVERVYSEFYGLAELERPSDLLKIPFRAPAATRYGLRSTDAVLRGLVDDAACRATLLGQCGDYGLLAERAPFLMHAAVVGHYLNGAHHPRGGGAGFVKAFTRGLKRHGGRLSLRAPVAQILVDAVGSRRDAVGVRLADGTELRARHVVSNADPKVTYGLVGEEHLSRRLRQRLASVRWSCSALSLFAVVDMDLRAAGLNSSNFWLRNSFASEDIFPSSEELHSGDRPLPVVLTVGTLKDPTQSHRRYHALEAITFVDYDAFARWEGTATSQRPPEYERFKARLADRMLAMIDTLVPGVAKRVVSRTLGTPLTNVHYACATRGAVYGTEKNRFSVGPLGFTSRSEIGSLSLCGASTFGHGVVNAIHSGLRSAAHVLGCEIEELLVDHGPPLTSHLADDPSAWPDELVAAVAGLQGRGSPASPRDVDPAKL
jgi:all-trans-retinol 13,14-reductase